MVKCEYMEESKRIIKIELFRFDLPLKDPFRISLGTTFRTENILVKIYSSDGHSGVGEGSPTENLTGETQKTCFEAAKFLGRLVLNKNPYAINERMSDINTLVHNTTAKSAFDIALYDLLAKRAGLPLYALLGGENRMIVTDNTIGIDTPEVMAKKALEIKNQGFQAIKVKLGTSRAEDVSRIRLIREAIGDKIPLRLDANQGWDVVSAELVLQELSRFKIQYCEEPVAHWNNEGLRRVREKSPIPIMADESVFDHHDAFRLASKGACDYINIKLAKSGGIHTALKINSVAESAGIKCMVGCMYETRLALSAAAHFASALPNVVFADLDSALMHAADPVIGGMEYKGGEITLPDTPGHGADFKLDFLKDQECVIITD
ncbi:MAG: dipeptide epimerase [Anaerolineales bacterium]|nr:dipeptide epimerase [Anaerolineales bacterium]